MKPVPREYLKCLRIRTLLCISQIDSIRTIVLFFETFKILRFLRWWGGASKLGITSILLLEKKTVYVSVCLGVCECMCICVFVSICVCLCHPVQEFKLGLSIICYMTGVCAGLVMAANKWKWKTHLHFQCTFPQFPQFESLVLVLNTFPYFESDIIAKRF